MVLLSFIVLIVVALIGAAGSVLAAWVTVAVRREVTPNGGDTDRLGDRVARIERWQHEHDERHDEEQRRRSPA